MFFTLKKNLGKGKNSRCYLTKIEEQNFCMKLIEFENEKKKKEIEKEIKILYSLKSNEKIINLHHHHLQGERKFYGLLFEWMEMNLHQFLAASPSGCISEIECKIIFEQILNALNFCHFNLITHQDLKLENVCIDPKTLKIKIIDFGFATISETEEQLCELTMFKGTPYYTSPGDFI
jgi:serine/threonine protein kinase